MNRHLPISVVGLLASALVASGFQSSGVPTDVQLPGTQPLEVPPLEGPDKCDNCHAGYDAAVEPTGNWRGSMMAQAGRDPLFWATLAVSEGDFPGAGDLCLRCHAMEGWIAGRSEPTDGSGLLEQDAGGVSCDVCHQMVVPDESEHDGVQFTPYLAHDEGMPAQPYFGSGMLVLGSGGEKLGPYDDPASPHQSLPSGFHRSSDLCGSCHDVSNPVTGDLAPHNGAMLDLLPGTFSGVPGTPVETKAAFNNFPYAYGMVERTYSEHVASAFPTLRVADYVGLPEELRDGSIQDAYEAAVAASPGGDYVDGTPRTFTCQTCHMPPVRGKGCNKVNAPVRDDLPLHDLTGANTWAGAALLYLEAQDRLVLGNDLDEEERDDIRAGIVRARATLAAAASLSVEGDDVLVTNLTGHKLPTGYPEGRRMWLHVLWHDAAGTVVREDGAYGPLTVVHQGSEHTVETLLDLGDPHLRIYEAHPGMTREWAAKLLTLGLDPGLPLAYDRVGGFVLETLGGLAAAPPGSSRETFRFVLNDTMVSDVRIPPYGFRYDDARTRNCLPVPEEQYGDPGPGGTFAHADRVAIDPPPGAVSAELTLLYQTTSWEYVQFLALANEGRVPSLATTGDDLFEAWQATGMSAPEVMATASWRRGGPKPRADTLLQPPPGPPPPLR